MKSSKFLIGGMLILATLTGCKSEEKKAEERAEDGNKMVQQLSDTMVALYTSYGINISPTAGTLMGGGPGMPSCVAEEDLTDVRAKLSSSMTLAHKIRGILNQPNITYAGDAGDLDNIYSNADQALKELGYIPDCA